MATKTLVNTTVDMFFGSMIVQLHDRMPLILELSDWPTRLGETADDAAALLRPAADGVLRFWPVSRAVNSVRHHGAELLDPIDDPHAPSAVGAPAEPNPA